MTVTSFPIPESISFSQRSIRDASLSASADARRCEISSYLADAAGDIDNDAATPPPTQPPPLLLDRPPTRTASTRRKSANRRDARASRIPDVQGSCRPRTIHQGAGSRTPPLRRLFGRSSAALTARVDPWAVFRSRRRWRKRHPRFRYCCCRHDAATVVVVVPVACCFSMPPQPNQTTAD